MITGAPTSALVDWGKIKLPRLMMESPSKSVVTTHATDRRLSLKPLSLTISDDGVTSAWADLVLERQRSVPGWSWTSLFEEGEW
jgi:hypothetical protein